MLPVQINKKTHIAKIFFNAEFYDMFPISEVCERFQNIFKITVAYDKDNKKIIVELRPKIDMSGEELQIISLEFCNHVLHEQVMVGK
jgi:hypothetical protein